MALGSVLSAFGFSSFAFFYSMITSNSSLWMK